jgi:peptidoglycan DL-endopeptidase CwlO
VTWQAGWPSGRAIAFAAAGTVVLLVLGLALAGAGIVGGGSMLFAAGQGCIHPRSAVHVADQPSPSSAGHNSIPASYLRLYQQTGHSYGVPWVVLAGIGRVESDHGQSTLPGVHSGSNAFGAAGPMQIGIGGAAGDTWGGAPVHPAGQRTGGVATDANGDGTASVYDPADAIAGAAKYLLQHGVLSNVSGAIFAYNHLQSYVQAVLFWAGQYSRGGFTVSQPATVLSDCPVTTKSGPVPNTKINTAIAFARQQIGKPYLWGGTGPDAFDCSGLVMMAYRAAGIDIPRTSQQQWLWGPRVQPGHEQPGDLVFFAGADGTPASPGHVALVIGNGQMIEAYATGFAIRITTYGTAGSPPGDEHPVGFTRPWQHSGVVLTSRPAG